MFFVNLALGAAAWVPARRLLRETRDPDRGAVPDALGIALLAGGVGALRWRSSRRRTGAGGARASFSSPSWSRRVLLAASSGARPRTRTRCWSFAVPRALVRGGLRGRLVFSLGFYAVLLANILFLTLVWGYSTLSAGFAVTPGPLMAALSSALAGRVIDRFGQRVSAVPGGLLFALGCLLFATGLGSSPAYLSEFLPGDVLTGIGVGPPSRAGARRRSPGWRRRASRRAARSPPASASWARCWASRC